MAHTKKGSSCAVHNDTHVPADARLNIVLEVFRGLEGSRDY